MLAEPRDLHQDTGVDEDDMMGGKRCSISMSVWVWVIVGILMAAFACNVTMTYMGIP